MFRFLNKNSQRGLSLLEISLVLVVLAILGAGVSQMISSNSKALQAKNDAEKLKTIARASQQYIKENYDALITATAGNVTIAIPAAKTTPGGASPASPPGFSSIQDDGFLPVTFVDKNSAQQSHALVVKQTPGGDVDAILTSYGGLELGDKEISLISRLLGASGGGVYNSAAISPANEIAGTRGGWGDNVANWNALIGGVPVQPASGTVQVAMGLADLIDAEVAVDETKFLHREEQTDDRSLNVMEWHINLGGFRIGEDGNGDGIPETYLDPDGRTEITEIDASGDIRSPVFFDLDDTNFLVDPASTSRLNRADLNDVRADIFYDRNNTNFRMDPASTSIFNQINASIMYDRDNTGYFLNPASTSRLNRVDASIFYDRNNTGYYLNPASTSRLNRADLNDVRADIFYDRNNTGYYLNPASTSRLRDVTITSIAFASDRKLKENEEEISGLSIIGNLNAKAYRWKSDNRLSYGLIAQEVEKKFPHLVMTNEDGLKSIRYVELIAPLIDAIQELENEIQLLKSDPHFFRAPQKLESD